ncbi:hypothetical protein ACP6NG_08940 [Brevibacterium casei]|uniref:hypothetical protein n=1 Tax=Brevibacterium casei TaxID=33889 RepID=UPI003F7D8B2E
MVAFKIRVQRTTVLPDGRPQELTIPFVRRVWEIYEVDAGGEDEYYGFSLTQEAAVMVVSDVVRARVARAAAEAVLSGSLNTRIDGNGFRIDRHGLRLVHRAVGGPCVHISLAAGGSLETPVEVPC